MTSFANGPFIPYLTVITGIAFWLRAARILQDIPVLAGKLVTIGRYTYSIMMHHIFAFFLVKTVFYWISRLTPLCQEFDAAMYFRKLTLYICQAVQRQPNGSIFLPGLVCRCCSPLLWKDSGEIDTEIALDRAGTW